MTECDWCGAKGADCEPPEPKGRVPLTICQDCRDAEEDRMYDY